MKHSTLGIVAILAITLAGCGGGSVGNSLGLNNNHGYFRFVNGSADSGSVDVYVDGNKINTNGPVAYGEMTGYEQVGVGSHTIAVDASGTQTAIAGIPTASLTQGVNGGSYVSLVLVGEQHPTVVTDTPNIVAYVDTPYSTPSGGFAVNFHNAAPVTGTGTTTFGITSATGTQQLGAALNVGGVSQPVGIPSTFISPSETVSFTATPSNTTIAAVSLTPSQIDASGCAANTLPCNSGNLSLYFIDGPAASTAASAGPYPDGITASQTATFAGLFDANGQ
ncbi:MAG TPA: DUF4397 domain-containing protein [Candidatus Baltobacteraceae bacterium]|nr:DUF4397 domain-containing protein [Candidatus Baltobacteraceae bacterium]